MGVEISWVAVALAALSTMVVGSIWYGPLFGKAWTKLTKAKQNQNPTALQMVVTYGGAYVSSFVTGTVLAIMAFLVQDYFGGSFLIATLWTAAILWAGFTAARIYMHDSFEGRRKKLTLLSVSHELVTFLVMAVIIGLLPA